MTMAGTPMNGQNHFLRVSRFQRLAVPSRERCCALARFKSRARGVSGMGRAAAALDEPADALAVLPVVFEVLRQSC